MISFKDNLITRNYTVQLFLTSILLTLSSANFAFDNQGFGQTQAMDPFIRRFGDLQANGTYKLPATFLSYSNAFPFIALVFGIGIGSMISAQFGRRWTVFFMSIWAMTCVPIIVTSRHRTQFLVGRCLNSIYIGMEMSVIPVFQAEIVPGRVRGLAVASYQMSFAFGGFVISGVCHRTAELNSDWAWKIPFLCYLAVPFVVGSLIWFQPESPRWLVSKGRIAEARTALMKFRKADHDLEHELEQIITAMELEKSTNKGDYVDCFKKGNLRRTLIVFGVNFFLQSTGQAFTSLYGPIIIKNIGTINPFDYTLINNGLTAFMYLINISINDAVGRRPLMLISAGAQAVFLFIIAGIGTQSGPRSKAESSALITFIILFALAFTVGWAPLSYLISTEIPTQTLRDKTTRMGFAVGIVMQFVVAFSLPYLLYAPYANLDMKVGFIFAPIAVLAFLFAWASIPECKGLALEQVDLLFEQRIPAWRSSKWNRENRGKFIEADESGQMAALKTDDQWDEAVVRGRRTG